MTKAEEYGLEFYRKEVDGKLYSLSRSKFDANDDRVILSFLDRLDIHETEGFICDLTSSITYQSNADEGFFSDSVEYMSILYQYPNVNIDDILIISMADMKALLEEWLDFIQS